MSGVSSALKRLLYLLLLLASIAALTEAGARIWLSARRGDAGFMTYPRGAQLAAQTVRTQRPGKGGKARVSTSSRPRGRRGGEHVSQDIEMSSPEYRGRALSEPQQARWRLAAVGGSSVFCPELAEDETWPEQLAAQINARDGAGSVEAINLGRVGASIAEVVEAVRDPLLSHPVEVVLIQSAFNNTFGIRPVDLRWESAPWHRALLYQRSLAYTVFFNGFKLQRARWSTTTPRLRAALDARLEELVELSRGAGMRPVFVLQPMLPSSQMSYAAVRGRISEHSFRQLVAHNAEIEGRHAALSEQTRQSAERLGVAWADPRPALLEGPAPQENFWVHLHLSALGARRLAASVDAEIRARYGGWSSLP